MKYDLVIWDFNGTICDDVQIGIDCINIVLERRNMKKVPDKDCYRSKFCFPIIDYYEKLGFVYSKEPYEIPAKEWTSEFLKREHLIQLNDGVTETLNYIKSTGTTQIVLSSSEITMLKRELDYLGVTQFFDDILGLDNTFAGGKIELAKKWAAGKKYNAVFIGDTRHDFDTAKAIGTDCILYSKGHDSLEHLHSCSCPVVDNIKDIIFLLR